MKPLLRSFTMFLRQILSDSMLAAVCIAPILTALFFYFAVPYFEILLCNYYQKSAILADYYLLFDLFLVLITPYMFCFASAMVMLTEYDENMASYLAVTPVGKNGYIISRLLIPAVISIIASELLMHLFALTKWHEGLLFLVCFLTGILSVAVSLFIFSFSNNRVEGMAMAKLSGLLMVGLPAPFFLMPPVQYLFSPLPSFWIARYVLDQNILFLLAALSTSFVWLWMLYRKFVRKLV